MANITWHPLSMDYVCTNAIICRYHLCIREKNVDRVSPLSMQNKTYLVERTIRKYNEKGKCSVEI